MRSFSRRADPALCSQVVWFRWATAHALVRKNKFARGQSGL